MPIDVASLLSADGLELCAFVVGSNGAVRQQHGRVFVAVTTDEIGEVASTKIGFVWSWSKPGQAAARRKSYGLKQRCGCVRCLRVVVSDNNPQPAAAGGDLVGENTAHVESECLVHRVQGDPTNTRARGVGSASDAVKGRGGAPGLVAASVTAGAWRPGAPSIRRLRAPH